MGQQVFSCQWSRAQGSRAGQTEIQGPSTGTRGCLTSAMGGVHPLWPYMYLHTFIFCSQAFILIRQDQAGPMTSVIMSTVVLVPADLCMQPHIPVCAQLHGEHTHPSGEHTQLCCCLDMGQEPVGALLLFNSWIEQLLVEFLGWQFFCLSKTFK